MVPEGGAVRFGGCAAAPQPNAELAFKKSGNTMQRVLGLAIVAMMMACGFAARAEDTEFDPAKVSESLKAIFQFGSVQSVADVLFLQGVDLGIVRSDTLDYLEKKGFAKDIKKQFAYVTKLYNEEMHVIAPKSIRSLKELEGKKVSVDLPNGGTFVTAAIVFERLGIRPNFLYIEQRIAMEKLRTGQIDAVIAVQGKPSKTVTLVKDDRLHLVPVDYDKSLQGDYLPATLTAKDYPNLISEQEQQVDTIAVPAVLAAYHWAPNTARYRKLTLFVDAFCTKFPTFQNPPFHPKWKEVSLSAPLADWQRFPAAKQWLDQHGIEPVARNRFEEFVKQAPAATKLQQSPTDKEALFKQFQAWEAERNASAQVRGAKPQPQ